MHRLVEGQSGDVGDDRPVGVAAGPGDADARAGGRAVPGASGEAPTRGSAPGPGTDSDVTTLWLAVVPLWHGVLKGTRAKPRERRTRWVSLGARPMTFGTMTPAVVVGGAVVGTVMWGRGGGERRGGGGRRTSFGLEVVRRRRGGGAGAQYAPGDEDPEPGGDPNGVTHPLILALRAGSRRITAWRGFHDCIRRARTSLVDRLRALFRSRRTVIARVGAILLPVGLAGVLVPFRATFAARAAALLLVAVIVGVAAGGDRVAGYVATVVATLSLTSC